MLSDNKNSKNPKIANLQGKFKFTKSLKFRLTLTYSLILFLFTSSFVLGINIYLNNYFKQEPPRVVTQPPNRQIGQNPFFELNQEEREKVKELRLRDLERIQNISVILLFPISLVSFAIGYYLSDRFLYPLKMLQGKIDGLKDKDLGSQVEIIEDDEVGDLARSFNKMSIYLKRSFDAQTQFVQDASHELKTPLTIIQTNLDLLTQEGKISKKDKQELIENALDGMKRVRKLTDRLLDLTLPSEIKKEKTDLNKLIIEQVILLKPFATKENVKIVTNMPTDKIFYNVDEMLMGRAVFNLVENAIKYSKDVKDANVVISLVGNKGHVEISIADNGKGIPKEFQAKIFERFYRVDKARSRMKGGDSGGFGLGLPITKKIVEEHGGIITLNSSNKGSEFVIQL
jgi:signal transduction histidine kinase